MASGMCFVEPTKAMVKEEADLIKHGVVAIASVENCCGDDGLSIHRVHSAVSREFNLGAYELTVRKLYRDDFLLRFQSVKVCESVLGEGVVAGNGFLLTMKPWKRTLYSQPLGYELKVSIDMFCRDY